MGGGIRPADAAEGETLSTPLRNAPVEGAAIRERIRESLVSVVNARIFLPLLGGLIFYLAFHWAYSDIPNSYYQVRDDGVITMSHARNLVEYGFIGVNPSGGRVEGYSAPVQLFLFAAVYAVTGTDYAVYAAVQTAVATFLLGALFALFFKERTIPALVLTALAALFLTFLRPFLQWHGSGMENAITHVLFLATVLILVSQVRMERVVYLWSIPVFLATVSRVESIFHIAPLLVIFGAFWWFVFRDWRGMRFSSIVLVSWGLFQLWRYFYFGDLLPNTAYAQSISVPDNLRSWPLPNGDILSYHGGFVLLLALPVIFVLSRCRQTVLLLLLVGSLILTAVFSEWVFGPARMDRARLTTHVAVFAALGTAAMFYHLTSLGSIRRTLLTAPALGAIAVAVFSMNVVAPYKAGWGTWLFDGTRSEFARVAEREALPRPTVSNPDLGAMSWHKKFNIVDFGLLGSPIMAKISGPSLADYFFDYAAPDMIESHAFWSCRYDGDIFSDPRFVQRYRPIKAWVSPWTRERCKENPEALTGFWIRTDILKSADSAERRLVDRLATNPSTDVLREELERCQTQSAEAYDCTYVARTAYRFLPEFRERGQAEALNDIFSASRTAAFDLYLINGYRDGQAHRNAMEFISNEHMNQAEVSRSIIGPESG